MKICSKCNKEKELIDFQKGRNQCKSCREQYRKEYEVLNKEIIKENKKKYYKDNLEKIKIAHNNYYDDNRGNELNRRKIYYKDNKVKLNDINKNYYKDNKESILNRQKIYYIENKERIKESIKKYQIENKNKLNNRRKIRLSNDPLFKLKCNLRRMNSRALENKGFKKSIKTEQIIGLSFNEIKLYLESKFKNWMNWENYGLYNGNENYGWDIDHIVPLNFGTTKEEIIKLNNYTNLQPLCSKINRDIKKGKMDY